MTLFEIHELIEYIANKDYNGNVIPPDQYGKLIVSANIDLFKKKLGLPEDFQLGAPISREYIDANKMQTADTRHLKVREATQTVTAGVITYPANYCVDDAIRYTYQRNVDGSPTNIIKVVECLTEAQYGDRAGNWTKKPSTKNPVYVVGNDGIRIYPATIATVDFNYYKYPTTPVFAYNQETGYITYNSGSSTEFDWPERLHMDLVRIILGYVGINIREAQLSQYAEVKKKEGV
ncbi:hypothetical protein KA005_22495 [bacterium]|nr:hypothetical protein [bacterium]